MQIQIQENPQRKVEISTSGTRFVAILCYIGRIKPGPKNFFPNTGRNKELSPTIRCLPELPGIRKHLFRVYSSRLSSVPNAAMPPFIPSVPDTTVPITPRSKGVIVVLGSSG